MSADTVTSRADLIRMIEGYRVSQALHVAARLGVADLLRDGPREVGDLAGATGTDAGSLSRLLRALASVGVFAEVDGGFALTPLGEYLRSDVPESARPWAENVGQPSHWTTWGHLFESVRTGEPAFFGLYGTSAWEYRKAHPEEGAIFNAAMASLSAGVGEAVARGYDFSGIDVLVDVGGGDGTLLAAILRAHPSMRGILFDEAHVVAGASPLLQRAGVSDRCEIVGGNFFDTVPPGADAYLMKSILHDWDDDSAVRILRACRAAIAPTGKLLVIDQVIRAGNDPDPAKFVDLNMLVMLGGRERTADDFGALYARAGFRLTRVVPTTSRFSVVEGIPV